MKIAVLTVWYNEKDLARLFCHHYAFADCIYILFDESTNDGCEKIASEFSNIVLTGIDLGGVMDDGKKQGYINAIMPMLLDRFDWVYSVDADEFIEPKNSESHWPFLKRQDGNLCYARMYQVYRHKTDKDINENKMPMPQRKYGDPNTITGMNGRFRKPIVVKKGINIAWLPGCHQYIKNDSVAECKEEMIGAHWRMADPKLAVSRRLKNRNRQGENNLKKGYSFHNHNITEKQILDQCDYWKENGSKVLC